MISTSMEWNTKQAKLKNLLADKDKFNEAIKLCIELHSLVHASEVSGCDFKTNEDILWND